MANIATFNSRKRTRSGNPSEPAVSAQNSSTSLEIFQSPTKKPFKLVVFGKSEVKPVTVTTHATAVPSSSTPIFRSTSRTSSSPKRHSAASHAERGSSYAMATNTFPSPVSALLHSGTHQNSPTPSVANPFGISRLPKREEATPQPVHTPVAPCTTPPASRSHSFPSSASSTPSTPSSTSSSSRWTPASATPTSKTSPNTTPSPVARSFSDSPYIRGNSAKTHQQEVYYVPESKETPVLPRNCSLSEADVSGDVPTWGLPKVVVDILKKRGLVKIYDWQRECLLTTGVVDGQSLVYSLPTSGGKTYVTEILMLREVHIKNKCAIFVLPYVSIVMEKVKSLKEIAKRLGVEVEGYYQNNGKLPMPKKHSTLCICTIEKANVLVNSLIEEGRLSEVGLVVFDEMHMLGDSSRGYLLEILGTKIKFVSKNIIQMVGMSATLPNLQDLALWINGIPFCRNFRPVKLVEHVLHEGDLLVPKIVDPKQSATSHGRGKHHKKTASSSNATSDSSASSVSSSPSPSSQSDLEKPYYLPQKIGSLNIAELMRFELKSGQSLVPPHTLFSAFQLVRQLMPHNCTLVFCNSKAMTAKLAHNLAELLESYPPTNSYELTILRWEEGSHDATIRDSMEHMKLPPMEFKAKLANLLDERSLLVRKVKASAASKSIDPQLEYCLMRGVAWHNSDLGTVERELIENAFRQKVVSVICCTSTLAAGVNLPARRVILMNNKMGVEELTIGEYRQMAGRAGRAGIDAIGESFLFVTQYRKAPFQGETRWLKPTCERTNHNAIGLLVKPLEPVRSTLGAVSGGENSDFITMRRARNVLYRRAQTDLKIDRPPELDLPATVRNITDPTHPVTSYFCLAQEDGGKVVPTGCGIDRLVLDAIAGRCAVTEAEIVAFVKCTFLAATMDQSNLSELVSKSIQFLLTLRMVEEVAPEVAMRRQVEDPDYDSADPNDPTARVRSTPRAVTRDYHKSLVMNDMSPTVLIVTSFGAATYRTPFSVEAALYMREELGKAIHHLNLERDLHLCWLVVPVFTKLLPGDPDAWLEVLSHIYPLSHSHSHSDAPSPHEPSTDSPKIVKPPTRGDEQYDLARRVGVSLAVLSADQERSKWDLPTSPLWQPTQRFILALLLQEIVEEANIAYLTSRYSLSKGEIESLMQNASNQAGQLVGFCKRMGWWHLESLLKIFALRVGLGVKEDIVPLMKIKGVKAARARILYNGGFRTTRSIAMAQPFELARVLSNRGGQDPSSTKLASAIIHNAKKWLDHTAQELRTAAHELNESQPTPPSKTAKPTTRARTAAAKHAKTDAGLFSSPPDSSSQLKSTPFSQAEIARDELKAVLDNYGYDPDMSDGVELDDLEFDTLMHD